MCISLMLCSTLHGCVLYAGELAWGSLKGLVMVLTTAASRAAPSMSLRGGGSKLTTQGCLDLLLGIGIAGASVHRVAVASHVMGSIEELVKLGVKRKGDQQGKG